MAVSATPLTSSNGMYSKEPTDKCLSASMMARM